MQLTAYFRPCSWPGFLLTPKIIRVMKLSAIFLLAASLQVAARTEGQTVTLDVKNAPIQSVFKEASRQTGISIIYNEAMLEGLAPVTIKVKNVPIERVLELCLKGQPFGYSFSGGMIQINMKAGATGGAPAAAPPNEIHGRVTDSLGNPLLGASVTVKGAKKGVMTDSKGEFVLKGVEDNAVLEISYTGFERQSLKLMGQNEVHFILRQSNNPLDQVQVIAYGNTTKRLNTGNVSTIPGAEVDNQPVSNPLAALEGKVPGLFIAQANGLAGGAITAQIQGQNSIQNGNDPFYVVDGVPYSSELLPNLGGVLLGYPAANGATSGSPFSFINTADIESISILKGADATAIYGSRAANGAILIITKKGKAGPAKFELNAQSGWGKIDRDLKLLNLQQYLTMRHEALNNDGITPSLANGDYDLLQWDTTRNMDWEKKLIGGTAQFSTVSASISGGTPTTQYLLGGTFHRETTVFPGDFSDEKGSLHFNLNTSSTDRRFHLQFSASYLVDNNRLPETDFTNAALTLAPDAPAPYNKNGSLNWAPDSTGAATWNNPYAAIYQTYANKAHNLISDAKLSYNILSGLSVSANLGYTNLETNETIFFPLDAVAPSRQAYAQRTALYGDNQIESWIIEPQINYKRAFGSLNLDALVGATMEQNSSNGQQLEGIGYNSDQELANIVGAATVTVNSTTAALYKYDALFGRLNLNWDGRYLLNLTGRRDGSSRFGPDNEYHSFGALGLGWVFSQTEFAKQRLTFLSFGKIRGSYGTTGSDQIGDYQFLSLYSPPFSTGIWYQGVTGLQPNGLTNPYLQWEETRKLEFGLDLGFLKDRILLNGTWYRNRTSNQLLGYALPIITGFTYVNENLPATVQNTGMEFTLNSTNVKHGNIVWTMSFNLTIPENKLLSFPGLANSGYATTYVIGQPITIQKVFHLAGVNPASGVYEFSLAKGDTTDNPSFSTDRVAQVNTAPKWYGGIQNNLRIRQFAVAFFFQFVKQIGQNYYFGNYPGPFRTGQGNQPVYVLDRWQKPGDIKPIQRYNSNYAFFTPAEDAAGSDAAYSDASFVRLKNASIAWNFPEKWSSRRHIQNARIFLQGQNLLTFTHYKGMDPENSNRSSIPPLRIITGGIQCSF
jgi:TonB-dependent starch-binding outer membrane protein SusC